MRAKKVAGAAIVAACIGAPSTALGGYESTTLEFSPATLPGGSRLETLWIESGYEMHGSPHFSSVSYWADQPSNPSNGTDFVHFLTGSEGAWIVKSDGSPFDAVQVDLAEYSTVTIDGGYQPESVEFEGMKADGSFVYQSFEFDFIHDGMGPAADFETFTFSDEFRGLQTLTMTTTLFAMDNLVLVIPSPPAWVLLVIGYGGGFPRRRRRARPSP